ncbi:MAG: DUF5050 domain-containing protein [Anaerobacillus sp.]|uniref:DUF5050 domain-containing protein n=1 Tax=Anaerobacillus sp. TaxID=1872506 RepID=UPI00391B0AA6
MDNKKILNSLSKAVSSIEVDVWEDIKNNSQSGLEEINSSSVQIPKRKSVLTKRRLIAAAIVFIVMVTGINSFINIVGRTAGMSSSSFLSFVEYDNKLFFENFKDRGRLYSMNIDGSNLMSLSDESVYNFVIDDNKIYYTDDINNIVITDLEGAVKKILENTNVLSISFVLDDWIYASNEEGIYRITIDGMIREKLSDVVPHTLINYGERIYFSNTEALYKADLDGNNATKIFSSNISKFYIYENDVFFFNINDGYRLYKINLDSLISQKAYFKSKSLSTSTNAFGISDNKLYFINERPASEPYLFEIDLDEENLTKLTAIEATELKVFGGNIYLYHPSSGGTLYKYSLEENKVEKMLSSK